MVSEKECYELTLRSIESADTLCDLAGPFIRAKSRRLVGTAGFVEADRDDIEQEARLRLVEKFEKTRLDTNLPVFAFIKRVVNQSIANQIRERTTGKRDVRRTKSCDDFQLAIDQNRNLVDLAIDVEELLLRLSAEERELCRALGVSTPAELARLLNCARSTIQDKARRLRPKFQPLID